MVNIIYFYYNRPWLNVCDDPLLIYTFPYIYKSTKPGILSSEILFSLGNRRLNSRGVVSAELADCPLPRVTVNYWQSGSTLFITVQDAELWTDSLTLNSERVLLFVYTKLIVLHVWLLCLLFVIMQVELFASHT